VGIRSPLVNNNANGRVAGSLSRCDQIDNADADHPPRTRHRTPTDRTDGNPAMWRYPAAAHTGCRGVRIHDLKTGASDMSRSHPDVPARGMAASRTHQVTLTARLALWKRTRQAVCPTVN
jgi:hypothetical protein